MGCCCQLQAAGLAAGATALQGGGIAYTNPNNPITNPITYTGVGTTPATLGDGSSSGLSFLDSGGFVQGLGSAISNVIGRIQGPQYTRLPNGQILLPNGQVLGSMPLLQSGSGMMLLIGAVLVIFLLMRK